MPGPPEPSRTVVKTYGKRGLIPGRLHLSMGANCDSEASRDGLFRIAVAGGDEEPVLPDLDGELRGNWAVAGDRLFYVDARNVPDGFRAVIRECDLMTGVTCELLRIASWPARFDTGRAATPDGEQLLFAPLHRSGADLFYMAGFR